MAAIFNFTMTAALPVIFSVIEHTKKNITGSLGGLPSPISIVWKFSDCPHKCPDW